MIAALCRDPNIGTIGAIAAAIYFYLRGSKDPAQTPPILAHHGDMKATLDDAPGAPSNTPNQDPLGVESGAMA
nr:hypothetical protein [uncultured Lichenicoccus sp.]